MGQGAEKFKNALASFKDIAAVSGVTRKRMRALALAGGTALSFEQLEKKDLMAGTVVKGTLQTLGSLPPDFQQPTHLVGLDNAQSAYKIINGDGINDEMLYWVGVRTGNPPYKVDYGIDASQVPTELTPIPEAPNSEPNSEYFVILGDLPETYHYYYGFAVNNGTGAGDLYSFLEGATVYAGFGPVTGMPDSIDEAIEMMPEDSIVVRGQYPTTPISAVDAYALWANVSSPNPLPGDFNNDGSVDAADYVVWRKDGLSSEDFNTWRSNFGNTLPGGSGSIVQAPQENNGGVPEASTVALVGIGTSIYLMTRRTREVGHFRKFP